MTSHLRIAFVAVIFFSTLLTVPGILSGVVAQQDQIVGGYGETSKNDPDALAAARFAVRKEAQKLQPRYRFAQSNVRKFKSSPVSTTGSA